MEIDVQCPSGLAGRVRPLKVKDESLFQDAKLIRSGKLIEELCKRCWIETTDTGPYASEDGKLNWGEVLQGDAFWVFIQLRIASYGNEYEVGASCGKCGSDFEDTIDLKELPKQELPEESRLAHRGGEPLITELEDGRKVAFKLLTTADIRHIQNIEDVHGLPTKYAMLLRRIQQVEGVDKRQLALVEFVKDLTAYEADYLLEQVEEFECGVETDVTLTCSSCGSEQEVMLPLEASFFSRRRKQSLKERKKKRHLKELSKTEEATLDG